METRDPAEAQESVQELDVDTAITPERKEDLKSNLAGNLVEHSEPISFATIVESVSPTELVNKLSDELPKTVIQKLLSENSNINIAPAQVLKPSKEDEMHVKEMKMMEAALQGAAQEAQIESLLHDVKEETKKGSSQSCGQGFEFENLSKNQENWKAMKIKRLREGWVFAPNLDPMMRLNLRFCGITKALQETTTKNNGFD